MGKTPGEMMEAVIRNLPAKTGRTAEEWIALLKKEGPKAYKDRVAWLKNEHKLGTVTANILSNEADGKGRAAYADGDALVDAMFSGPRASLRPLYEALVKEALQLGKDVRIAPCRTYVALIRKSQFAILKPTTQTRIDVGLALADAEARGRLEAARSLGGSDRITHHIKVGSREDIDAELKKWLNAAYVRDA